MTVYFETYFGEKNGMEHRDPSLVVDKKHLLLSSTWEGHFKISACTRIAQMAAVFAYLQNEVLPAI